MDELLVSFEKNLRITNSHISKAIDDVSFITGRMDKLQVNEHQEKEKAFLISQIKSLAKRCEFLQHKCADTEIKYTALLYYFNQQQIIPIDNALRNIASY